MTVLSICIPTRNRQTFAMDAVRHMLRSTRQDFEVLVADNSDNPEPLRLFAADVADSRLRVLPPEPQPLSMRANWDRLIPQTRGEWLIIIGDDDYADPEICEVIRVATAAVRLVDAIAWGRSYFSWPDARAAREVTVIPTGSHLVNVEKKDMMRKMFFWEEAKDRPGCPFGIYHGAVRRELMERIRSAFSNTYFEHGNVDYDNICKTVMMADAFVFWERPMSVFGACRASNSMGLRDQEIGRQRNATFFAENPDKFEADNFPFPIAVGVTASIGHTIESFKQRYGIELKGWEENFISACAKDCETCVDRAQFETRKAGYAKAIKAWRGAAALSRFKPEFKWRPGVPKFLGTAENLLFFDMAMGDARSAAEFYDVLDAMLFPVHLLETRLTQPLRTAEAA